MSESSPLLPGQSSVGYEVTITHRNFQQTRSDWHVQVKRLSDGMEIIRTFEWRCNARRFARSRRRIGKAFARADERRGREIETFTLGWRDG